MPDYTSRKRLKKKVLSRWENEGGMIPDEQTGIIKSGSPDERVSKGDDAQSSESTAADRRKSPKTDGKRSRARK